MGSMDDAGVYKITDDIALVQSLDFLFPAVNDPRDFGRIVAANSLSDIWAMGAKPLTAMNILAYPAGKIPEEAIEELLIGGCEKLKEAGVALLGGHTLEQETFIYGMSVTGSIHPALLKTNSNARVGDLLILTKPIGTGVMSSAVEKDGLNEGQYNIFVETMYRLNKYASETLLHFDVSALTDVTGFGLLGHALPFARNADVTLRFDIETVPFYKDIFNLMEKFYPLGVCKTEEYIEQYTSINEHADTNKVKLLSGAQTSGGLLAAVRADQAEKVIQQLHDAGDTDSAIIGEVCARDSKSGDYYLIID